MKGLFRSDNNKINIIFNDKTLVEMAQKRPINLDAMAQINGVGAKKLENFGNTFLEVINGEAERLHPSRRKLAGNKEGVLFDLLLEAQNKLTRGEKGLDKPLSCSTSLLVKVAQRRPSSIKEISYIHAEAYPGGELKHGPLALIDKNMPVIALAPDNEHLDKITSNIEEVAARKGKVITIGPLGRTKIDKNGGHIKIPKTLDLLNPIVSVVPMQLIAVSYTHLTLPTKA